VVVVGLGYVVRLAIGGSLEAWKNQDFLGFLVAGVELKLLLCQT
jgi:hypothetical protein